MITEYYLEKETSHKKGGENKTLELELPDNDEISSEVLGAILNKKVVLKESMKTLNDFKLLQIAWIFDLNFNYSLRRVYEKNNIEKIFNTLPNNKELNKVREIVNQYFETTIDLKKIKE